jgi:CubicO group peptidase (beta-lactamase class C family)
VSNDNPLRSAALAALLNELVGDHHVPGAQVAVRWGESRVTAVSGCEEHGQDRPVSDRSKIPAGSIGKAFTATVAMVLVADGDLGLDDPIDEHITDLRAGRDLFGRLTPRQLLSHTSGLPSSLDEYLAESATHSARRYLAECGRQAVPVCPAGTAFSYSNVGYVLIGHLIEEITGLAWHEAVESILLRPLGIEPSFLVSGPVTPSTRPPGGPTPWPRPSRPARPRSAPWR